MKDNETNFELSVNEIADEIKNKRPGVYEKLILNVHADVSEMKADIKSFIKNTGYTEAEIKNLKAECIEIRKAHDKCDGLAMARDFKSGIKLIKMALVAIPMICAAVVAIMKFL